MGMTARDGADPTDAARLRAIVAGSFGNLIEWYDFYAYAYTALYFAAAFFPGGDRTAQLLNTAAIYAAGFLVRPLGGWYFGRFADRHGRRAGMVVTVALMGAGALLIAVLPDHAAIGAWAPAGLLAARLMQGFSTGGQYGAAATYLSEMAPPGRRGLFASFQFVTLIAGQLLAILVIQAMQALWSDAVIAAWAWRVPFLIGALLAGVVLLLRNHMVETVRGEAPPDAGSLRALLHHPRSVLVVAALSSAGAVCLYSFTTYMQKFLVNTSGLSIRDANRAMLVATAAFMVVQPAIGALSDRIGRRRSLMVFCLGMALAAVPLMLALARVRDPLAATGLVIAGLLILSFYTAISGLFKAELFPARIRALGVGFIHSTAAAVFGGTVEVIALQAHGAHREIWFYGYIAATCLAALVSLAWMDRNARLDPQVID
jgi:MFS family permease